VEAAIRDIREMDWPPKAISVRLLDLDGREAFARPEADD